MKNINLKSFLPHLAIIGIFIIISVAYFNPILSGKEIKQSDMTHAKGMAKELSDYHDKTGEYSQWTNSMFSGMPAYNVGPYGESNNIFYKISSFIRLNLPSLSIGILFVLLLGFYILLVTLNINPWLSLIGAIGFAFSSYNFVIIEAGHVTKAYAIAYMAPVIAGIIMTYNGKYIWGAVLTTIALGLEIATNHFQISYYLFIAILIFIIFQFFFSLREKALKQFFIASGILVISAIFAIAPSATTLYTNYELSKESIRGKSELTSNVKSDKNSTGLDKDYALAWSYGVGESFTALIPDFKGGESGGGLSTESETYKALIQNNVPENQAKSYIKSMPTYWGDMPFTSGTVYFGAIICFFFVLGLFIIKGKLKWWLLVITLLSFLLSWGKNFMWFNDIFFYYFPFYNKFRAVSMALVIAGFSVPFLALLSLNEIFTKKIDKKALYKPFIYSLSIVGGICLIFLIFPSAFFDFTSISDAQYKSSGYPDWLMNAIIIDRESLLKSDAFRSLVFIALSASVVLLFVYDKIKSTFAMGILALIVLTDLWAIDKRYLNDESYESKTKIKNEFVPTEANLEILKDKDPNFRVFNLNNPFNEVNTSYFHKSIGGYHGAKLRRYQDVIDYHLSKNNRNVLNMLNTKYIILYDEKGYSQAQFNPGALGNAWFIKNYKIVNTPDSELTALNNFNPASTAIIDKNFESSIKNINISNDSTASIKLLEYNPNKLVYTSKNAGSGLAVFSEIYYKKGWNAYIDGKETPNFRVNYILRALAIPAGEHKIEFKFEPKEFYISQTIAFISSVIIIVVIIGLIIWQIFIKKLKK